MCGVCRRETSSCVWKALRMWNGHPGTAKATPCWQDRKMERSGCGSLPAGSVCRFSLATMVVFR
ncbi:unnamed protein product, partial [Symbiodinium microadriaticum]